jgi:hypothetical protein
MGLLSQTIGDFFSKGAAKWRYRSLLCCWVNHSGVTFIEPLNQDSAVTISMELKEKKTRINRKGT